MTSGILFLYSESTLTYICSYRFLILSVHVIVLVTLFFYKVTGGNKPVLIKQFTVVLALHVSRLDICISQRSRGGQSYGLFTVKFLNLCPTNARFVIPVSVVRPRYSAHILFDRLLLLSSNYTAWVKKRTSKNCFVAPFWIFAQKERSNIENISPNVGAETNGSNKT